MTAPVLDNVYNLEFTSIKDSNGDVIKATGVGDDKHIRRNGDMTDVRISFETVEIQKLPIGLRIIWTLINRM